MPEDLSWLPDPPKADLSWLPDKPTEKPAKSPFYVMGDPHASAEARAGTMEGLRDTYQMVRHPLDTLMGLGAGLKSAADAVPDVARNLVGGHAGATLKGFAQGATHGATGVDVDEAVKSPNRAVGRFIGGVVIPAAALKGAGAGLKAVRGMKTAPAAVAAGEAAPTRIARGVMSAEHAAATPAAEAAVNASRAVPKTAPTETPLPQSWRQFVKPEGASVPRGTSAAPKKLTIDDFGGLDATEKAAIRAEQSARGMTTKISADDAARYLREHGSMIPPGTNATRAARHLSDAQMENRYRYLLESEQGAVDPKLLATVGLGTAGAATGSAMANEDHRLAGGVLGGLAGVAAANPARALKTLQQVRMMGMLSGAALPKSVLGNIGAVGTAAAEGGTLAPIKEALRLPTVAKDIARGFKTGANPAHTQGVGALNVPGRLMGAMDEATTQALLRAGLAPEEAQRLLLTAPNPLGHGKLAKALESPLGQAAMPFQRIPFNQIAEGVNSLNELAPKSGASNMRRGLTIGAGAAGAAAGSETENPYTLAILAALMGPRSLPFALGAGATAGPRAVERIASTPDFSLKDAYNPLGPIDKPALMRLLDYLGGDK